MIVFIRVGLPTFLLRLEVQDSIEGEETRVDFASNIFVAFSADQYLLMLVQVVGERPGPAPW